MEQSLSEGRRGSEEERPFQGKRSPNSQEPAFHFQLRCELSGGLWASLCLKIRVVVRARLSLRAGGERQGLPGTSSLPLIYFIFFF